MCHLTGLLIEATAGNTGIGLIHIAKQYNYNCLFVAPDKTSSEKVELLKTLGSEVELAPTVPITGKRSRHDIMTVVVSYIIVVR